MLKVKIIDAVNNTVLEELLFAYDVAVNDTVDSIQSAVSNFTDSKIRLETELCKEPCSTYQDKNMIAAKIFRRINSVNPYNND